MSPSLPSPLLVNEKTREPYLRLPPPHSNIILTPPRRSDTDVESIVQILNDRVVYQWLEGPPYPYHAEHARAWIEATSKAAEEVTRDLEERPGQLVGGCPVRILREVAENGGEIFLGDCGISRSGFEDITDPVEREKERVENEARPSGDPEIVWVIGDYLNPSHQGRGIMTLALGTLIEKWYKPQMGATKIKANLFKGNQGSRRVFEKNGFVLGKTLEDYRVIPESKGGGLIGMDVMEWQVS